MINDYINKLERYVEELENRVFELKKGIAEKDLQAADDDSQTAKAINALRTLLHREIIKKDERIKELENKYLDLLLRMASKYPDDTGHQTTREFIARTETFKKPSTPEITN